MITLSTIITQFESELLQRYGERLLPGQRRALSAMKQCRTALSPKMLTQCSQCEHQRLVPHSCGHRLCPHCQHHESQQWIERQLAKQVPGVYFMLTFTLPSELRSLAYAHQRLVYAALMRCAWETVRVFSHNDKQLQGTPGATAVLHTHSRRLDFHPHVHLVMPAAALDTKNGLWRSKRSRQNAKAGYLFSHKALAKVFRAKMLDAINKAGLTLPKHHPTRWVVDCKHVGRGNKALVYLGRYLYRGVISEKDILACKDGQVTFRYRDSATKRFKTRTLNGADFLWLVLKHVLPKGLRRARDFGFLHPNSKRLMQRLRYLLKLAPTWATNAPRPRPTMACACCGGAMKIVRTRMKTTLPSPRPPDLAWETSVM